MISLKVSWLFPNLRNLDIHYLLHTPEPGVPGRLASAIRSWPEDVNEYKGGSLYNDLLLPNLDRAHEEQIRSGVVHLDQDGEPVGKDRRTYPF